METANSGGEVWGSRGRIGYNPEWAEVGVREVAKIFRHNSWWLEGARIGDRE